MVGAPTDSRLPHKTPKRGGGGAGRQKEEKSLPVKFHRLKIFRCSTPCHHHLILSFSRLSSPRAPGKCTKRKKRREKNSSPQVGPSYAEREREKGRLAIAQGRLLKSTGKEKWNEKRIEGERETVEGIEPAILEASVVQQLASKHLVFFRDSSKFYFINFHHIFAKYESPDGLAEKFRYVIELKNKGGWRQTARRLQSQCAAPRHLGIFPPLRRRRRREKKGLVLRSEFIGWNLKKKKMPCSAYTLSLATIAAVISVALVAIAFSTDNWSRITVDRLKLEVRKQKKNSSSSANYTTIWRRACIPRPSRTGRGALAPEKRKRRNGRSVTDWCTSSKDPTTKVKMFLLEKRNFSFSSSGGKIKMISSVCGFRGRNENICGNLCRLRSTRPPSLIEIITWNNFLLAQPQVTRGDLALQGELESNVLYFSRTKGLFRVCFDDKKFPKGGQYCTWKLLLLFFSFNLSMAVAIE